MPSPPAVFDEIAALFEHRGSITFYGEGVSTTQHALQTAHFARTDGASAALTVAALLHDIGHLLQRAPDDLAGWTKDAHHEQVGARWLAQRFGADVSEPVRLHVAAKRYLCATDAGYLSRLSPASVVTLKLQGGPMSAGDVAGFEAEPFQGEAVRVRRWDDRGKVAGLPTPALSDYRALIERVRIHVS